MVSRRTYRSAALAICVLLTGFGASYAQHGHHHHDDHHHHGGISIHRHGFHLIDPHGHHVDDHHDHYHYVVPHVHGYGSYYTYNDVHYFTPPVVAGRQQVAARPVAVEFGSYQHFEELAQRLEAISNQLCLDLHYNYRHNRDFRETYREAYQLMEIAKFIHDREHRGDRQAIAQQGDSLDQLFHYVQGEVAGWTSSQRRPVGRFSIEAKLEEMEALIHHLLFDIGVKPRHDAEEQAPPPEQELAPPPEGEPLSIDGPPPAFPR